MGYTLSEFKYIWPLQHSNDFFFEPSPREFSVEEIPLYDFSDSGEHLVLKIRKKGLTTWQMLDILSSYLGVSKREIGYAGLKDKHAITIQYISLPKRFQGKLESFEHSNIKILESYLHSSKIRVGHLKGNKFWMRFKRVQSRQKITIESVLEWMEANGMPNYFGVQRFGNSGNNYLEGKAIIDGKLKIRDRKKREFLISAYQSYLFNQWLAKRINLSTLLESFKKEEVEKIFNFAKDTLKGVPEQKQFFKLLEGDLFMHYPFGKIFYEELACSVKRFLARDIAPTGLLAGKRVKRAQQSAYLIEEPFDEEINEMGSRRYAWIFPVIYEKKYTPQSAWYELSFYLPKGSYATVLVDFLKGREIE